MPPKAKYTSDIIIKISREIIAEQGFQGLSAREISGRLGATTAPIFTCFGSMDELIKAVYYSICNDCKIYLLDAIEHSDSYAEFCLRWVNYARSNPRFYEFVFLLRGQNEELASLTRTSFKNIMQPVVASVALDYGIEQNKAALLIENMNLILTGLCVNVIYNIRKYSDEDIANLVNECCAIFKNGINYLNSIGEVK